MLRQLKGNQGQSTVSEYVMIFFLVIGVIVTMTVYVKRTLQARVIDGRNFMIATAREALGNSVRKEYEPYYTNTVMTPDRYTRKTIDLQGSGVGGSSGRFLKTTVDLKNIHAVSRTLPPRDAD
ncbi:MAG: hypothetical protein GY861_23870 [bacterium]|nr:hypothetical protein [bacterium]